MDVLSDWFRRHFSDPQAVTLTVLLVGGFAIVLLAGRILAPLFAAIVIAFILDGAVGYLVRMRMPRLLAVVIVFTLFIAFILLLVFGLAPILSRQVAQFFREVPSMIGEGQALLMQLPERYPNLVSEEQIQGVLGGLRAEIVRMGQHVLSVSVASVTGLVAVLIYTILVPFLVFFLLKDKDAILRWITGFLPEERRLSVEVWAEVNVKIASYVRGKFIEIMIVWSVTFVTFLFLKLNYAALLSFLVGLSVIIPYVGAAVVTLPVAFIAYFQFGPEPLFVYTLVAYGVIQFLDGNLLVPLLFSEVVNLHPVAIIAAVLVFGGLWGVWGVFFAIPLATLVQAVIKAWPTRRSPVLPRPGPAD